MQADEIEKLSKKRFVRERLTEGQKVARAMKATLELERMVAPGTLRFWRTVSQIKRVRACRPRRALATAILLPQSPRRTAFAATLTTTTLTTTLATTVPLTTCYARVPRAGSATPTTSCRCTSPSSLRRCRR